MNRRMLTAALTVLFVTASCGSSDSSSSDEGIDETPSTDRSADEPDELDTDSPQAEVAAMFVDFAESQGLALQPDCASYKATAISDDDASAIAEAGPDGEPEVSAEGEAIAEDIITGCIDSSNYVRTFAESLKESSSPTLDVDCVVDAVGDAPVEEVNQEVLDSVEGCSDA